MGRRSGKTVVEGKKTFHLNGAQVLFTNLFTSRRPTNFLLGYILKFCPLFAIHSLYIWVQHGIDGKSKHGLLISSAMGVLELLTLPQVFVGYLSIGHHSLPQIPFLISELKSHSCKERQLIYQTGAKESKPVR